MVLYDVWFHTKAKTNQKVCKRAPGSAGHMCACLTGHSRCARYQSTSASRACECGCMAGRYQSGCAGVRSERHVGGRRSCTWGIWKASHQSAVWCGEAGFPSGWRRLHTEHSGKASHLKEMKTNCTGHDISVFLFFLNETWKACWLAAACCSADEVC